MSFLDFLRQKPRKRSRRKSQKRRNRFEPLESRRLLALDIVFDYTYDSSGFFTDSAKGALERAATDYENRITDTLAAIPAPTSINSWTASFRHPGTGATQNIQNLELAEDEVRIFVGARNFTGSTLGQASTGYGIQYISQDWLDTVTLRGQNGGNETSTWGGSIAFDASTNWHFDAADPSSGETDLYSVALHEIGHIFGISDQAGNTWTSYLRNLNELTSAEQALVNNEPGEYFVGPKATEIFGSPVPAEGGHFEHDVSYAGAEAALDPNLTTGTRKPMSPIDWAALDDIGWDISTRFISGTAFDDSIIANDMPDSGEGEAGLTVTATNESTSAEYTTTTHSDGTYALEVSPGTYTVTFTGGGYEGRVETTGLTVGSDNIRVELDTSDATWINIPVPAIPAIVGPSQSTSLSEPTITTDATPAFEWESVLHAATYQLWVAPVGVSSGVISVITSETSFTPGSDLPAGSYRFFVRAINSEGERGAFSQASYFDVVSAIPVPDIPVPAIPVIVGPSQSTSVSEPTTTTDTTPAFEWESVPHAATYQLWVAPVGVSSGVISIITSETSFTAGTDLPEGSYRFFVRAINSEGERGVFSQASYFNVASAIPVPAIPVIVGPSQSTSISEPTITTDTTPAFEWESVPHANTYQLWVAPVGVSSGVISIITSETSFTSGSDLPEGSYRFFVRAINSAGERGAFSQARYFNVASAIPVPDIPVPAIPVIVGPSQSTSVSEPTITTDTTPAFEWESVPHAATYQLWVAPVGVSSGVISIITSETSFTAGTDLPEGSYRFFVRAINSEGERGVFSQARYFDVR